MSGNRIWRFPASARVVKQDQSPAAVERRMLAFNTFHCPRCDAYPGRSCITGNGVAMRPQDAIHNARLEQLK